MDRVLTSAQVKALNVAFFSYYTGASPRDDWVRLMDVKCTQCNQPAVWWTKTEFRCNSCSTQ
jgi:hypothetical protein